MKTKIFLLWLLQSFFFFSLSAQNQYQIFVNIQNLTENREVKITIIPPKIDAKTATFIMPIHAYSDAYGSSINIKKHVKQFRVFNEKNKRLKYEFVSNNGILLYRAKEIRKIEYYINIDYLNKLFSVDNQVFNEEKQKCLVFEHQNIFGYLQSYSDFPFHAEIQKPSDLYGATALPLAAKNASIDTFSVPNYAALFSKPILYAPADTTSFQLGKTRFHISIFSESGQVKAYQVYNYLKNVSEGMKHFFGDFPVRDYHFILYFSEKKLSKNSDLSNYGGSMCANASFYRLPELRNAQKMKKVIYKIASHELLHLLSPYQLHSEKAHHHGLESENTSQHLWLYEGVTEYLSCLALRETGLWSEEVFWEEISRKISLSEQFETVSLTKMSEHIYQKKYRNAIPNIYYRGALAAFLLDIEIQKCSENGDNLLSILQKMTKKYSNETAFRDKHFIDEFVAMTCPEVHDFFDKYIIGSEKLPFLAYFAEINMTYFETYTDTLGTYGKFVVWPNYQKGLMEFKKVERNELGLQSGNVLLSINGEAITTSNFKDYQWLLEEPKPRTAISLEVIDNNKIKYKKDINSDFVQKNKKVLRAKAAIYIQKRKHYILKKE